MVILTSVKTKAVGNRGLPYPAVAFLPVSLGHHSFLDPSLGISYKDGQEASSLLCFGELNIVVAFHSGFTSLRGLYRLIPKRSNLVTLLWPSEISVK